MKTTYIGYFSRTQNVRDTREPVDADALAKLFAAIPPRRAAPPALTLVKGEEA